MTGTFIQPAFGSQTGTAYKTNIDNSIAAMARIAAAFAPHEQDTPDMTVRVDAGALWVSGATVEQAAQDSAAITAPTTNPRIDRVVIDAITGVVSVITGTQAASPAAPAITSGKLPVCQVLLQTTTTAIDNTMITDERIMGGGGGGQVEVGSGYQNTGVDPATELGYGTWSSGLVGLAPQYPPAHNTAYVKATSNQSGWDPFLATDPAKSLIGGMSGNGWNAYANTNQRFHFDAGLAIYVLRVYYENGHISGSSTNIGAKNFTMWGSNSATAFAELTYGTDTNWTQLTTSISQLLQHVAADSVDPQFFTVECPLPYRYFAFKFADNWGAGTANLGLRRLVLQSGLYRWIRTA